MVRLWTAFVACMRSSRPAACPRESAPSQTKNAAARYRGAGILDPFTHYVQRRFQAACTSSMQLYRELIGLGYAGSYHRREPVRDRYQEGHRGPRPDSDAQPMHDHLMDHAPAGNTPALKDRATGSRTERLPGDPRCLRPRMGVHRHDPPSSGPPAAGLDPESRGEWPGGHRHLCRVEGHANRSKTIKRQMYGRASFTLLRARILQQPPPSRENDHNPSVGHTEQHSWAQGVGAGSRHEDEIARASGLVCDPMRQRTLTHHTKKVLVDQLSDGRGSGCEWPPVCRSPG